MFSFWKKKKKTKQKNQKNKTKQEADNIQQKLLLMQIMQMI